MIMLTDLKKKPKVVGTKQTLKAIEEQKADVVFVAYDTDGDLKKEIISAANAADITIEYVDSKLKLGRACGIDVSAASAALLK